MRAYRGVIQDGVGDMGMRFRNFPEIFNAAAGEQLAAGTLNVRVDESVPFRETFRVKGADIREPNQDLIFEECRVNGVRAYRVRPLNLKTGRGGHGDHILELASGFHFKSEGGLKNGDSVEIVFAD